MNGFLRRLMLIGSAGALVTALGTGVTAAPALAANGPCSDVTNAQPTPLHYLPSDSSQTVKFLNNDYTVTGTCNYYNNESESRWYMQVNYIGPGNNGGYGYIWVQRLDYGSAHECVYNGTPTSIGSGTCPLYPYD